MSIPVKPILKEEKQVIYNDPLNQFKNDKNVIYLGG